MGVTRVLIANRGEIAVRILRACRELGIESVAVYSEADREALHVRLADQAVAIGPAEAAKSYLDMDALVAAARRTGADAVHPGYGFLSENARFARRCEDEGLTFIGPSSQAIEEMGDKIAARAIAARVGAPITPGTDAAGEDPVARLKAARKIPLPVMVKAAGGGGGKGMRVVHTAAELEAAITAAGREATSSFGKGHVYVERFIEDPRHIEFQVLGDQHGGLVHLFERECSIQRRHQKLVEETPSVALTPALRERMGESAVRIAREIGYHSAGTIEFLLDRSGEFYFLEMNTRIQVEHPITELTTGIDLVAWQIRIARGERLPFEQADLQPRGHAIECRLYAEDPARGFVPSPGRLLRYAEPSGPGVRVDGGVYEGYTVTPHYDPILAKVIVWGETREVARSRMGRALADTVCLGVETPIELLREILSHEAFAAGDTHTGFLPQHFASWKPTSEGPAPWPDAVLIAAALADSRPAAGAAAAMTAPNGLWQRLGPWRVGSS
jgi:acetyl-CoA carboxylase biotin carboxylase subunit